MKKYQITLEQEFIYYLLGYLGAKNKNEIINSIYLEILSQVNDQNKEAKK